MKVLKKEELESVKGGVSFWVSVAVASTFIFIAGVIEGQIKLK